MEYAISLLLGIGLSASCGFRVFVPLLVASIAGLLGYVNFSSGFEWMQSWVSFTIFAVATIFEIGAYYIPWIDNILDTVSKPLAVVAGSVLTLSFLTDMDPMMKWILGIIVGGGSAGVIAAGSGVLRAASSVTTGGVGNWLVSTVEHVAAIFISVLTIFIPVIMGTLMLLFIGFVIYKFVSYNDKRKNRKIKRKKIY